MWPSLVSPTRPSLLAAVLRAPTIGPFFGFAALLVAVVAKISSVCKRTDLLRIDEQLTASGPALLAESPS